MFEIYLDIPAQKFLKIGMNEKVFRIRAGKYRVLYRVDYKKYIIVIIKIDLRKHVYLN